LSAIWHSSLGIQDTITYSYHLSDGHANIPWNQISVQMLSFTLPFGTPQRDNNGGQLHQPEEVERATQTISYLPGINVKAFFRELRCDNGSPRELTTGKRLDSLLRRLCILVLDVDLANTEVDAGTSGAGNLGLDDGSVLAALLFDVFLDFYSMLEVRNVSSDVAELTFVFIIVEQLVRGDHVHQADDTAVLVVLSSAGSCQH